MSFLDLKLQRRSLRRAAEGERKKLPKEYTERVPSKARAIVDSAIRDGMSSLLEYEAEEVAKLYGIPVPKSGLATTEKQSLLLSKRIGFPVVMKIVSPDILHKTDVGGVKIGINSSSEVRSAFREILRNAKRANKSADIRGVYMQKMEPKASEFVIGGIRDPQFGPTVMFGLGGVFIELFKDVQFRLAPLSMDEAVEMMKEIKAAPLLTGFRGSKALDVQSAARVIQLVGKIMNDIDGIESIDINPILIYQRGCSDLDVRMILRSPNLLTGANHNSRS